MGIICANEGVPVMPALWSLAYQTHSALLQAALKLLPIGPAASQQLLHAAMHALTPALPKTLDLPEEAWGSFNPVWDIGASQHETAAARMFIS
jgi:urease accessory protein UreF